MVANTKDMISYIQTVAQGLPSINLMEVCGTHTMAIARNGIQQLLPKNIKLISGPGCPVCVTSQGYIDKAVSYSKREEVIIATFGDMLRVPGSGSSLEKEKSRGAHIEVVYSALDALEIAQKNLSKTVIFLAVGFETTAPTIAATIIEAKKQKIKNFFILCSHKLIPPAMQALLKDKGIKIDGFILPGHVTAIIGLAPYRQVKKPCVVSGFEAEDILLTILMLLNQIKENKVLVENQYRRVVKTEGNRQALRLLRRVFEVGDSDWRGLGKIPKSGFRLRPAFANFDIETHFTPSSRLGNRTFHTRKRVVRISRACKCAEILKGKLEPEDCKLFRRVCSPENPVGACMVSCEGTCAAHYKYGDGSS